MSKLIILDDHRPHSNTAMTCPCGKHWIATHPSECKSLECPACGEMVSLEGEVKCSYCSGSHFNFDCPTMANE